MKRTGILNRHLSAATASLGHTDEVVIADAGLPIPDGPTVVDLSVVAGTPCFVDVLDALLDELVIEQATAAHEVRHRNPDAACALDDRFRTLDLIPHEALKARTENARLIVRTGEATPYANVILRCGVAF